MSVRDWIVLSLVGAVIVGASVMSIIGAARQPGQAQEQNAPHLASVYKPVGPEQVAVVSNVVGCLVQYGKLHPGHTSPNEFDPTPLSQMTPDKRATAVADLRRRLEGMCVAYGIRASQSSVKHGPASHLTEAQFIQAATALSMDVEGAKALLARMPAPR